jgi:1,4-dihydroxy-2-naphthoate octaprenyltransferase
MSDTAVRIPFSSWILATRPKTLVAGAVPVLVGAAAAADGERLWLTPFCLFCSLLIQIGTNLFNDVYDFERGADNAERLGPVRVTQAGLIPPRVVKGAAIACFVGAAVCGLVVVVNAGVILAVVGAVCLLCGWLYTGGPWPLAYHGLGEVFVFIFFGIVATAGTAFAVGGAGAVRDAAVAGCGVGALATGLILVNNLRDREGDAKAGKRTLCVRFGDAAGHALYVGGVVIAAAAAGALAWHRQTPWPLLALPAVALAALTARQVMHTRGGALNPLLGATARALSLYGLLLAIGLVFS